MKRVHLDIGFKYASAAAQRERVDAMKRGVVAQLERCPRSLIVFDDFQWAPEKMILSLRDAFDPAVEALAFRDRRVATHQAVFVFCSDLEAEQRHLRADMTNDQVLVATRERERIPCKGCAPAAVPAHGAACEGLTLVVCACVRRGRRFRSWRRRSGARWTKPQTSGSCLCKAAWCPSCRSPSPSSGK